MATFAPGPISNAADGSFTKLRRFRAHIEKLQDPTFVITGSSKVTFWDQGKVTGSFCVKVPSGPETRIWREILERVQSPTVAYNYVGRMVAEQWCLNSNNYRALFNLLRERGARELA